jgi:hypothetical protein
VTITQEPPALTNQTTAAFTFSSTPPSAYECTLDDPTFTAPQPCDGTFAANNLPDGSHTFAVRAVPLGPPTEYTWTIDTAAPDTTLTATQPSPTTSTSATFAFTSSEPGSTFFCSLDSSGFSPCSSPQTYSGLGGGTYTFRVQAVDAAGNADPTPASYTWQVNGPPPVADLRPPANVTALRRDVGYGRLHLRWRQPGDSDFDHVNVYVSTNPKTAPRTIVYSGRAHSYLDRHFKNGQFYRYLIVSYDHAKNASGGTRASIPPSALLLSPRNGTVVRHAPTFRWTAIPGARFYNIQLYTHGEKVLSTWPGKARQVLTQRWQYKGRRYTLRPGLYVWWVWPGFGPRSRGHYGHLLGQGSFVVR